MGSQVPPPTNPNPPASTDPPPNPPANPPASTDPPPNPPANPPASTDPPNPDAPPPNPDDPPKPGETVPRAWLDKVTRESINRKERIRALEAENAKLKGGGDGPGSDDLRTQLADRDKKIARMELVGEIRSLTDGRDGRPSRVSDRVVDLIADDAESVTVEPGKLDAFVREWQASNPNLLRAAQPGPPSNPAADARAPDSVRRAAVPDTMDPEHELAAWDRMSASERQRVEREKPGTRRRLEAIRVRKIVENVRKEGVGT